MIFCSFLEGLNLGGLVVVVLGGLRLGGSGLEGLCLGGLVLGVVFQFQSNGEAVVVLRRETFRIFNAKLGFGVLFLGGLVLVELVLVGLGLGVIFLEGFLLVEGVLEGLVLGGFDFDGLLQLKSNG